MDIGKLPGDVYGAFIAVNHSSGTGAWDFRRLGGVDLPSFGASFTAFTDTISAPGVGPEEYRFEVVASPHHGPSWQMLIAQFDRWGKPCATEPLPSIDQPGYNAGSRYNAVHGRDEVRSSYDYYNFFVADEMVRCGVERIDEAIASHQTTAEPDEAEFIERLSERRRELEDIRADFAHAVDFPWMRAPWVCQHEAWPSSRR